MSRWLALMGLLTMTGPLAIDMYLPAFPSMTEALAAPPGAVERTLALYLIGMAAGQLLYGPASDRFGRKAPLYVGLALFTMASIGCATASSIETLTVWRVVQALGGSACMVVPRAVIRDHYDTQGAARAMSLLMLVIGVAPVLAPILGAQVLLVASWRAVFGILALIGAGLLVALHFGMRETLPAERRVQVNLRSMFVTYGELLRHRHFLFMALAGGLGMGGLFAYVVGAPRTLIEYFGLSPQMFSLLFALNAIAMTVASQVNARLLTRLHPQRVVRVVLWVLPLVGLTGLALSLAGWLTVPLFVAVIMAYMACQGFVGPNSAALALQGQGGRLGAASAMLGTLQFTSGTVIGLAVSAWDSGNATSLLAIIATAGTLACLSGRYALQESARAAREAAQARSA
ncbi:multidrug effflux MFS transporter [Verticiella sediminum]|nr:multidrug effflux MFS transporter [Verticiella sediminum]